MLTCNLDESSACVCLAQLITIACFHVFFKKSVLQVIEANDATRMLYCHDGTHTVVVHLPPQALSRYRVGQPSSTAAQSSSGGASSSAKASSGRLSGSGLRKDHGPPPSMSAVTSSSSSAGTALPLTLNRLGARRCLVAVKEWHWSTAVVCGAWMRGSVREAGNDLLNKCKPFCIQVRMLSAA